MRGIIFTVSWIFLIFSLNLQAALDNWGSFKPHSIPFTIKGKSNLINNPSRVGTTEILIVALSHGNAPADQIYHPAQVLGGDWNHWRHPGAQRSAPYSSIYGGDDDKCVQVWVRYVTEENKNKQGRALITAGGKVVVLVYDGILKVGNVADRRVPTGRVSITNKGAGPFLVIMGSDNGGRSTKANKAYAEGSDDPLWIYLTPDAKFEDRSVGGRRGGMVSMQLLPWHSDSIATIEASKSTNMIGNPSFETAGKFGSKTVTQWILAKGHSRTTEQKKSGSSSLKSTRGPAGSKIGILVKPGATYIISGYILNKSGGAAYIDMSDIPGEVTLSSTPNSQNWEKVTATWTNTSNLELVTLRLVTDGGNKLAYFDDISFVEKEASVNLGHPPSRRSFVLGSENPPAVLQVIDPRGKLVRQLFYKAIHPEQPSITINTLGIKPGVYYIRGSIGKTPVNRRLLVLR